MVNVKHVYPDISYTTKFVFHILLVVFDTMVNNVLNVKKVIHYLVLNVIVWSLLVWNYKVKMINIILIFIH